MTTKDELKAGLAMLQAVAEAVRESGNAGLPEGPLYAHLCGKVTLEGFNKLLGVLVNAGLIERKHNVCRWIGPAI